MLPNSWGYILKQLPLGRFEKQIADKFQLNTDDRCFLFVSDILKKYGYKNEALELLLCHCQHHKDYTTAHVKLAEELFQVQRYSESFESIILHKEKLKQNILAQKLFFKLGILFSDKVLAVDSYHKLESLNSLQDELKTLGEILILEGITSAKISLERYLKSGVLIQSRLTNFHSIDKKAQASSFSIASLSDIFSSKIDSKKEDLKELQKNLRAQIEKEKLSLPTEVIFDNKSNLIESLLKKINEKHPF